MKHTKLLSKLISKFVLIGFLLSLLNSCAPFTKESYLEDYKQFIEEVKKNHENYAKEDWREADEKFNQFSGEWYNDWKDEMTWKEKMIVSGYEVQYNLYKGSSIGKEIFKFFNKKNVKDLKEKIKEYKEQNMDKGIKEIQKQAEEMGEEAVKEINEIFKELNIDPKKYQ